VSNWFLGWKPDLPLDWIENLRPDAPHAIRWFHPEDCHVTLAFFGRLSPERVREICARLAASAPQRFSASIGKPLLLPSPRRFSALSFSIESDPLRSAIAQHRDEWLALAALPHETRDPLPHLTFARPDRRASSAQLRAIRAWMNDLKAPHDGTVTFEGPLLFTWAEDRSHRQFNAVMTAGSNALPNCPSS
jgi:RNA 2',3'-cyclic 3'-phosphodiesterase